jgi:hypothetical protein
VPKIFDLSFLLFRPILKISLLPPCSQKFGT